MKELDEKKLGIITAGIPHLNFPNTDVWSYIYPFLEKYKELTALVCSKTGQTYTYNDIIDASIRWAKELEKHFVDGRPPTVACMFSNIIEYTFVFLGCQAAGAPIVPARHNYETNFISSILSETEASILVLQTSKLPSHIDLIKPFSDKKKLYVKEDGINLGQGEDIMKVFFPENPYDVKLTQKIDPETISMITFTSGTTGKPKGVLTTQRAIVNFAFTLCHPSICCMRTAEGTFMKTKQGQNTVFTTVLFSDSYGYVYICLFLTSQGGRIILSHPFDFSDALTIFEKYKPDILKVNPFVIQTLNEMADENPGAFASVKYILTVGTHPNPDIVEELQRKTGNKFKFMDHYGTSENGLSLMSPINCNDPRGTCKLIPNVRLRLEDIKTRRPILEPGKLGELFFETKLGMKEYLNNPEATKEQIDCYHFYRSGDVGYYDEENNVYVIDRLKDIINANIFPTDIENVLLKHPSVISAGVVEALDLKTGSQIPQAFVIRKGDVNEEELTSFVQKSAPREMWLDGGLKFVKSLPRNYYGKLERKYLRTMSWFDANKEC